MLPRSRRLDLPAPSGRVVRARHVTCAIGRPCSSSDRVRSRVAEIARTQRVCRGGGAVRRPRVQASSSIERRRQPARPTITGQLASPACRHVVSPQSHRLQASRPSILQASRPSIESARKEEGENPRVFNQLRTRPPSRWGDARGSTAPAPQSKPVTHASRLVAQIAPSVAAGLGLRILAAGPATYRLYSYRRHLCEPTPRVCSGHRPVSHRLVPCESPARVAWSLAAHGGPQPRLTLG